MSTPIDPRPYPPGEYPVVIVGSGPAGLQASYLLDRMGIRHAVISADPGPGGMFRRFPFFQRLLSWTKPYAGMARDTRQYERYDWNSLLAMEPGASGTPGRPHGRLLAIPVAAGDGGGPGALRGAHRRARPLRHHVAGHLAGRRAVRAPHQRTATTAPGTRSSRWASRSPTCPTRLARSTSRITWRRARLRPTPASGCSSWASRTAGSSSRRACSSGRTASSSPLRARPSCRSTRTPWRASGRATCSPGRTPTWAAAWPSSTPRSSATSAPRRRHPCPHAALGQRGGVRGGGRRGHRGDRIRVPAAGPAGAGRGHLRPVEAADDDQPLRERHGAGHLLRGHHRPGRGGPAQVRPPGELRGGPRRTLQPAADDRDARRAAPWRAPAASRAGSRGTRGVPARRAVHVAGAVAPEVVPGARGVT